jgi:phosphoribosylformylglycinamidine cyclo-ligase
MKVFSYKDAGVDIEKADNVLNRLKHRIQQTFNPYVLNSIGGFAAVTAVPEGYKNPVMVSSTDGVGTKLKIAFAAHKHDTVGIDLVAMSANDILTMGAKPLFFLDYFATGRIEEKVYEDVVVGICNGCTMAECSLIGGETAEMPSFYKDGEYDLAGFVIGFAERDRIVNGSTIREGDAVVALASNGLHSNGYSLVRKVLFEVHSLSVRDHVDGIDGELYEELLRPTRIYVKPVLKVLERFQVKGMAHITGGGLPGNICRVIPEGLGVDLQLHGAKVPSIFKLIRRLGGISLDEMCSTFNMGVGYVLVVGQKDEKDLISQLEVTGEKAFTIGYVRESTSAPKDNIRIAFDDL